MARKTRIDRLLSSVVLTASQRKSVLNQVAKGIKNPTLKVQGVTVSVDTLKQAQGLLSTNTPQRGGRRERQQAYKREGGMIINKFGVAFTVQERKDFERKIRNYNRRAYNIQLRETLLQIEGTKKRLGTATAIPADAVERLLPLKSYNISGFTSKEQFYEYQDKVNQGLSGQREDYLLFVEKENYKKAIRAKFGASQSSKLIRLVNKISDRELRDSFLRGDTYHIGDIYSMTAQERASWYEELYADLSQLAGEENDLTDDDLILIEDEEDIW